ncbi:MAG: DUF4149 domain-containing protein [Terracidiphilus sp.]
MKTLFRTLLSLALITWLGAEIFFPVVAVVTFKVLQPDTHTAGAIVGHLLRILHGMGLASGLVALIALALTAALRIYKPRAVLVPMGLLALMLVLTVYSQVGILPAMERDRIAAGGAINVVTAANESRIDFEKLHRRSVYVEEAVLLLGLATVLFVAKAETEKAKES